MAASEQSPQDTDEYADWARRIVMETYAPRFKDPADLELLAGLPEAFAGATCPETEVRYLNLLDYTRGIIPKYAQGVLKKSIIHKREILVVGTAGINIPDLTDEELDRATISWRKTGRIIALPVLRLADKEPVIDLTGHRLETTVLEKNPFQRIRGETFQWVRDGRSGWVAPIVIGVQNGLIMERDKLLVVEGRKNRAADTFEWRVKRPVFDNGKYEAMSVFMEILRAGDFAVLNY